jgi:alkylhydroperoxidase/carboxymuconolactone decarboxylase family protein YurZ
MEILPCCQLSFALAAPERLDPRIALERALGRCPLAEVEETILQSIPYSGFPAAVESLGWLRELHPDADSYPRNATKQPESFFQKIYGESEKKIRSSLRDRHEDLERWIIEFAYGTVMESSWLSSDAIEALAVSSLIGQARLRPLHSHLRGALRTGHTRKSLTLLLDSLQKVAHPEVLRAAAKMIERECSSD